MPEHLYRFRSIHALLDGFQELERQEIYFAATDELNDPMEGYLQVVWRGDATLWENLLKHYLLCLLQSATVALIAPEFTPDLCKALPWYTRRDILNLPLADLHQDFCDNVLASPSVSAFMSRIGKIKRAVSREELLFYLMGFHPDIFTALLRLLEDRKLVPKSDASSPPMLENLQKGFVEQIDKLLTLTQDGGPEVREIFASTAIIAEQMALLREYQFTTSGPVQRPGWKFITREFQAFYVAGLEDLVYPRWRVACFVEEPTNASMWGVYGDAHRGVCLKFRTKPTQETHSLSLDVHSGWAGALGKPSRPTTGRRSMTFSPVRYGASRPEIEFFTSLGFLPRFKLEDWLFDREGRVSTLARPLYEETEAWRASYWAAYEALQAVKTEEWRHEKEHRLILASSLTRELDAAQAKAHYDFADLAGIIFGARMSEADKVAVMKIVERKCREAARFDFEFHQARYDQGAKLHIAPLPLLRIAPA